MQRRLQKNVIYTNEFKIIVVTLILGAIQKLLLDLLGGASWCFILTGKLFDEVTSAILYFMILLFSLFVYLFSFNKRKWREALAIAFLPLGIWGLFFCTPAASEAYGTWGLCAVVLIGLDVWLFNVIRELNKEPYDIKVYLVELVRAFFRNTTIVIVIGGLITILIVAVHSITEEKANDKVFYDTGIIQCTVKTDICNG